MNELDRIMEIIEAAGFSHTGKISMDTVELRDEVRDMCRNGNCGKYDRNWSCPPGCGTLEQCRKQLFGYKTWNSCADSGRVGGQHGLGRHERYRRAPQKNFS